MRTITLLAALLFSAGSAHAACTCVCENGRAKSQCPSVLEKPIACPANLCEGNATAAPAQTLPKGDCKLEKVINPQTGRIEMQRVCK